MTGSATALFLIHCGSFTLWKSPLKQAEKQLWLTIIRTINSTSKITEVLQIIGSPLKRSLIPQTQTPLSFSSYSAKRKRRWSSVTPYVLTCVALGSVPPPHPLLPPVNFHVNTCSSRVKKSQHRLRVRVRRRVLRQVLVRTGVCTRGKTSHWLRAPFVRGKT